MIKFVENHIIFVYESIALVSWGSEITCHHINLVQAQNVSVSTILKMKKKEFPIKLLEIPHHYAWASVDFLTGRIFLSILCFTIRWRLFRWRVPIVMIGGCWVWKIQKMLWSVKFVNILLLLCEWWSCRWPFCSQCTGYVGRKINFRVRPTQPFSVHRRSRSIHLYYWISRAHILNRVVRILNPIDYFSYSFIG